VKSCSPGGILHSKNFAKQNYSTGQAGILQSKIISQGGDFLIATLKKINHVTKKEKERTDEYILRPKR